MQQTNSVGDVRLQSFCEHHKLLHNGFDIKSLTTGMDDFIIFNQRSLTNLFSKRIKIDACANANADPTSLVGVCRSNTFERRTNLVLTKVAFRDGIKRLVPRKNEVCLT